MSTIKYMRCFSLVFLLLAANIVAASEIVYLNPEQNRWVVNNEQSIYALSGHEYVGQDYKNNLIILANKAAKLTEIDPLLANQLRFQLYPGKEYFYKKEDQQLTIYRDDQKILSVPLNSDGRSNAFFRIGEVGDFYALKPHRLEGYVVGAQPLAQTHVAIYSHDDRLLDTVMTDMHGFYQYPVAEPGTYHVVVEESGFERALDAVCNPQSEHAACHITPFSTLTSHLIDHNGHGLYTANSQFCDCTDCLDPFAQWAEYFAVNQKNDAQGFALLTQEIERHRGLNGWLVWQAALLQSPSGINALHGTVKLASRLPIRYGEIRLITDTASYAQIAVSNAAGEWVIPLQLLGLSHLNAVRIEVDFTRGRISETFSTELSADILAALAQPSNQCAQAIEINAFTTLADRYRLATGAEPAQTQRAIQRYFNMPTNIDLADTSAVDRYYSRQLFVEDHSPSLKFDHVIAEVWRNSQLPPKAHSGGSYQIVEATLSAKILDGVVGGVTKAGVGFILDIGFTYGMSALGFPSSEQQIANHLAQISDSLQEVHRKIDLIPGYINALGDRISTEVRQGNEYNRATSMTSSATNSIAALNASYRELDSLLQNSNGVDNEELLRFKELWRTRDIPKALEAYDIAFFSGSQNQNALYFLTSALALEVQNSANKNQALADAYYLLQSYFLDAMVINVKGMIVQANIDNWDPNLDASDFNPTQLKSGTERRLNDMQERINRQVDIFLMNVERLVVASADTRTQILGGGKPMFPDSIHDVFREADLTAKVFNPKKYDAALVVRVIGDPTSFYRYVGLLPIPNAGPVANAITGWDGGQSIRGSRGDISHFMLNNREVRSYHAPVPSGYKSNYIGWRWVEDNKWEMDTNVNQILVTKFKIPFFEKGSNNRFTYDYSRLTSSSDYPHINNPREVEIKKVEDIERDILFGHTVVFAREIPRFYEDNRNQPNSIPGIVQQQANPCFNTNLASLSFSENRQSIQFSSRLQHHKQNCDFINTSSSVRAAVSFFIKGKQGSHFVEFNTTVSDKSEYSIHEHEQTLTKWTLVAGTTQVLGHTLALHQGYVGVDPATQRYFVNDAGETITPGQFSFWKFHELINVDSTKKGNKSFAGSDSYSKITFTFEVDSRFPPDPFASTMRWFGKVLGVKSYIRDDEKIEIRINLHSFEMKVN